MCLALTLKSNDNYHFFGRNMDIEYDFSQKVLQIPRNFKWINKVNNQENTTLYTVLGMGTVINNYPLLADGFNEKGLACSGLNFPDFAFYEEQKVNNKLNLSPYDFIFYVLSSFDKVDCAKRAILNLNLVNFRFIPSLPLPPLHWIVYDKSGDCIVIEKTKEHFKVYDNTIGILSNSPNFPFQIQNLNYYANAQNKNPNNTIWNNTSIKPTGLGLGMHGIPGDFYPTSRFVRSAFLKNFSENLDTKESTLSQFFHILDNVAMVSGSVKTLDNKNDITLYSSCMCLEDLTYYYKTYNNNQLNGVRMTYDTSFLSYDFIDKQNINYIKH